jgi:hypothetical protein
MRMTKSRNGKAVVKTESAFYAQVRDVFVQARQFVHKTANFAMVKAYWLVGKMIVEKQGGEAKAAYGDRLIASLSIQLTADLGKGFTQANLRYMRLFYLAFRNCHTLCDELSWSHYRLLISVENEEARAYYLEEARKSLWSVRERTAIEDANLVARLDADEIRGIKKSAFVVGKKGGAK